MKKLLKYIFSLDNRIAGVNRRNRELIYQNNKRVDYDLADDKALTKMFLENEEIPVAETYAVIEHVGNIEKKWNEMSRYDSVAIKPARGKGGGGIMVLYKNQDNTWASPSGKSISNYEVKRHIANILFGVYSFGQSDRAIIEYCIQTPSFFTDIFPEGVPDIRLIALQGKILVAMLRIPTNESDGKGNLHQGALGVDVDLKTGILGQAYNYKSYLDFHPDTKAPILGQQIPHWQQIIEISQQIVDISPLKYLGIDIVIDKKIGPLVMELNVRPGIEIQNVTKQGLLELIHNNEGSIE